MASFVVRPLKPVYRVQADEIRIVATLPRHAGQKRREPILSSTEDQLLHQDDVQPRVARTFGGKFASGKLFRAAFALDERFPHYNLTITLGRHPAKVRVHAQPRTSRA